MRVIAINLLLTTGLSFAAGQITSASQANQVEARLKVNPTDRAARADLLEYYFRNSAIPAAQAIPARRTHILWLIQNTPADPLAGAPAATIDASGHRLADPEGYRLAAAAWKEQIAKAGSAQTLLNAAYFFKLSDRPLTVSLLERAIAMDPKNAEAGARLGDQYAAMILGITMVNGNGFPTGMDPAQTSAPAAQQARAALESSRNPYVLSKAGYMLAFQGTILRQRLAFDPYALAETALGRALSQAPGQQDVSQMVRAGREMIEQARSAGKR